MSTAILEGYGDLIIHDGNTDFTIVKPTPFATNSTKVKRWWRQNYNVVTYEACAIVELLDFYIVVSCAQDVQLKMTFDGTSAVTFDVGYDKPGDGNIERILVVPKTEFHNPVNYDDYYYDYSTRELRKNSYGNGAVFDIFLDAALDLKFAESKSLVDSISGNDLVSFTRASSGTFVGADGLIKSTSVNFALNSNIVQGSSIGTAIPNSTESVVSPRGITETVRRLGRDVPAGGAQVWRVGSTSGGTPNTTYTISFYAKTVYGGTTSINVDINDTTPTGGQATTITGEWTRITKTGGSANNNLRFFDMNMVTATEDFYVWGAQIEIGTTATDYIPTTNTISGAPRFDHDPATGESLGLLIEEARTNILLKSEKLDAWFRGSNSSVTANQAVAPDGTTTADRVQHGSVGSSWLRQNVTTPGVTYTISIYAKAVTPGTNDQFSFELGFTSPIFTATGEWQRFTFTNTAFGTSVYLNNGNDSFATDVYFWGAQVEEGDFATSYIPTDSSTVTRAADVAEITGTNFSSFFNAEASTVFVNANLTAGTIGQYALFAIKGSNSNGAFNISRRSAQGSRFNRFNPSGSQDIDFNGPTWTDNSFRKLACAIGQTSASFVDSGSLIGTTTTYVKPAASDGLTKLLLGNAERGGFVPYNIHIKRLAYFPTRLSDATLQAITS